MASDTGAPIAVVGKVGDARPAVPREPRLARAVRAAAVRARPASAPTARATSTSPTARAAPSRRTAAASGEFVARTPLEVGTGRERQHHRPRRARSTSPSSAGWRWSPDGAARRHGAAADDAGPDRRRRDRAGLRAAAGRLAGRGDRRPDDPLADPQLVDVGRQPYSASAAGDLVYVADAGDRSIARLDAATGDERRLHAGRRAGDDAGEARSSRARSRRRRTA